jgi:hypothetical protein
MLQYYSPTDLNMSETTHPAYADVSVFDADYGNNGAAGWVNCPSTASTGFNSRGDRWCIGQVLKINCWPAYSLYWNDTASKNHLACHELGHTIGFQHWLNQTSTCMIPNWYDDYQGEGPAVLHPNEIIEINWYYPAP